MSSGPWGDIRDKVIALEQAAEAVPPPPEPDDHFAPRVHQVKTSIRELKDYTDNRSRQEEGEDLDDE